MTKTNAAALSQPSTAAKRAALAAAGFVAAPVPAILLAREAANANSLSREARRAVR